MAPKDITTPINTTPLTLDDALMAHAITMECIYADGEMVPGFSAETFVTVLQSADGKPANKGIDLDTDGKPVKRQSGHYSLYRGWMVAVPNLIDMAVLLDLIGDYPDVCLCLGQSVHLAKGEYMTRAISPAFYVASKPKLENDYKSTTGHAVTNSGVPVVGRLKDHMRNSQWIMFDRDFDPSMPADLADLSLEDWRIKMAEIEPALVGVGWVDFPSTSTRIRHKGKPGFPGRQGSHHYVRVTDPAKAATIGTIMHARATLKGICFDRTNINGAKLEKGTIFDKVPMMVQSLSFDGAPHLMAAGLTLDPAVPVIIDGPAADLSKMASLDADERKNLQTATGAKYSKKDGSYAISNDQLLTFDTVIFADLDGNKDTPATLAVIWRKMLNHAIVEYMNIRAQTPFRESASEAAFIKIGYNGLPELHDTGTATTYRLPDSELPAAAEALVEIIGDAIASGNTKAVHNAMKIWGSASVATEAGEQELALDQFAAKAHVAGLHGELTVAKIKSAYRKDMKAGAAKVKTHTAETEREQNFEDNPLIDGEPEIGERLRFISLDEAIEIYNTRMGAIEFGDQMLVVSEMSTALQDRKYYTHRIRAFPNEKIKRAPDRATVISANGEPTEVQPFGSWCNSTERRDFSGITMQPKVSYRQHGVRPLPIYRGMYDCWQGYLYQPLADQDATDAQIAAADMVDEHIRIVYAAEDDIKYQWMQNWFSVLVRHPEAVNLPVPCLIGPEGTGKDIIIGNVLRPLHGPHGLMLTKSSDLTGDFNSHLGWKVFVYLNEAVWGGNAEAEGALKSMLTDDVRTHHQKFKDLVETENHVKSIISSQNKWYAPDTPGTRRFAAMDVSDVKKGDKEYFIKLAAASKEGKEVLLHRWMNREVTHDEMREPPQWESQYGLDAKLKSADQVVTFLFQWASAGTYSMQPSAEIKARQLDSFEGDSMEQIHASGPHGSYLTLVEFPLSDTGGETLFSKYAVYDAYRHHCQEAKRVRREDILADNVFWRLVRRYTGDAVVAHKIGGRGEQQPVVSVPCLKEFRQVIVDYMQMPVNWPDTGNHAEP